MYTIDIINNCEGDIGDDDSVILHTSIKCYRKGY